MTTTTTRTLLRSDELSCPSCVSKIEKSLLALPGVTQAEVKFSSGRIEVEHDPALSDVAALVNSVAKVGYAARPETI
jgi:copper chaperone CopZ